MSLTTFSSQPRIIEAKKIGITFRSNDGYYRGASFHQNDNAYLTSVEARNFLHTLKKFSTGRFYISFDEKTCIDEGNIDKSFTNGKIYRFEAGEVELDASFEDIVSFVFQFVKYDKQCYPSAKLSLLMRWNESTNEDGYISSKFEIRCVKFESQ